MKEIANRFKWLSLFGGLILLVACLPGIVNAQAQNDDPSSGVNDQMQRKLMEAQNYMHVNKPAARQMALDVLSEAQAANKPVVLAHALVLVGKSYYAQNSYDSAILFYDSAKVFSRKIKNQQLETESLISLGEVYSSRMEYESAYNYYYNALLIAIENNSKKQIAYIYNELGGFYYNCDNYVDAEIYWQKGKVISHEIDDQEGIAKMDNNLGEVYRFYGEYQKALTSFEQAVAINIRLNKQNWLSTNYDNMGMIFSKLGDKQKALDYINKGIDLAAEIAYAKGECTGYASLALFYMESNQSDSALKYFKKSYRLAGEIHEIKTLKIASGGLSKVYESQHKPDSALIYQKEFKSFSDTILNGRNLTRVSLILGQTQFENEKRIQEIAQRKSRNRYFAVIAILLMSVIVVSLIYFYQRNKFRYLALKKQHLELEKKYLNNELTNFAMHISQKNDLLSSLKLRIKAIRQSNKEDQSGELSELNSLIIQNLAHNEESEVFQENVDKLNHEFIIALKQQFPELTPKEIQLCTLLKLKLSTKEIASIRKVTPRAIKVARYRLRKKLRLPLEGNISDFLNTL